MLPALFLDMGILAAIMILLLIAIAALPAWPYSQRWSFYPTGACGGLVLFLLAMILSGRL
jgi:hypothetical protein